MRETVTQHRFTSAVIAVLASLCFLGCGKQQEEALENPEPEAVVPHQGQASPNTMDRAVEDAETRERRVEAEKRASYEKELEEEIDAYLAEAEHRANEDVLENPVFKQYFDEMLRDYEMTDDQKKRFGEVIHLLKAVDPQNFDSPDRETRLGLSGATARRLIETTENGDVSGFIDDVFSQVEEIAIDPIDAPSAVTSRRGVILHFDERKNR